MGSSGMNLGRGRNRRKYEEKQPMPNDKIDKNDIIGMCLKCNRALGNCQCGFNTNKPDGKVDGNEFKNKILWCIAEIDKANNRHSFQIDKRLEAEGRVAEFEADNQRLREALTPLNKKLLLEYLNNRIAYYDQTVIPDQKRYWNNGVVAAYHWLRDIIENDALKNVVSNYGWAADALKPKEK